MANRAKGLDVLAVSPHPDDVEFGCGGTLLKLRAMGHRIHLLYMTKGEMGGDAGLRQKEAERAAKVLRAESVHWAGFEDTCVPTSKEAINAVERVLKEVRPSLIFKPHQNDTHQDHRATSQVTFTATRYSRNVVSYECPSSVDFTPNVFVDIGKVLERKMALLKSHGSQVYQTKVPDLSILENARSVAIFRGTQHRVKFAEGFIPVRLSLDFHLGGA